MPLRSVIVLLMLGLGATLPGRAAAVELPALSDQDTIVVRADQAWESADGSVLHFQGNFELSAPDFFVSAHTAELHGDLNDPHAIKANGSPTVTFWVLEKGSNERTHGRGQKLEFYRADNLLRLSGDAVLNDANSTMRSSLLEYDTESKRLIGTGDDGVEIVTRPNRD